MNPEVVTSNSSKGKSSSKILILILSLIVVVVGAVAGFILVRQNQQIEEKASTPTGTVKMYLAPETKTVNVDQIFGVNVILDTKGQSITAITIDLSYPYSGSTPPINAEDIQINSVLAVDENWKFPIKTINSDGGKVQIKIGGLNSSQAGYKTTGEETVATINFKGVGSGTINLSFNPTTTQVTNKDTGEDILLTPSSSGTYTVAGTNSNGASATPTATASSLASPSPTSTSSATAVPWTSPTPSPIPAPESGVSFPTIIGVSAGALMVVASFVLIF